MSQSDREDAKSDVEGTMVRTASPPVLAAGMNAPTNGDPAAQAPSAPSSREDNNPTDPKRKPDPTLPRRPVTRAQSIACILSIAGWITLAIAGVAVPTKPYIDMMGTGTGLGFIESARVFFILTTCYTFTNIALLCCLSAIIGAVGRSVGIDEESNPGAVTDFRTLCIAAIIRGFFMYIVIVSGTLILADQKFDDISIQQYLQLAGLVSLLSFAVGYDPTLFGRFFSRFSSLSQNLERPKTGV